ncbi:4041_t:CDS:1, partial [Funneliformis geosporum]
MEFTDKSKDKEQDNEYEVSISTSPILSSHVFNSPDDSSEIDLKNSP